MKTVNDHTSAKKQKPIKAQLPAPTITYDQAKEYHLNNYLADKEGNERSRQTLKNEESRINCWAAYHRRSGSDLVGEELGINFITSLLEYLSHLSDEGRSKQTISDHKSTITRFQICFSEQIRAGELPQDFPGALRFLINRIGLPATMIAPKAGVPLVTLKTWYNGTLLPRVGSLRHIKRLEKFFGLTPGTLSARLPEAVWKKNGYKPCTTVWRRHHREIVKLRYRSPLPAKLQEDFEEMVRCYTDPKYALERKLNLTQTWRIRWNTNKCVSADIALGRLLGFYGFLTLSPSSEDETRSGLGFKREDLCLAMLSDANLVIKYLYFAKARTVTKSFNYTTLNFLIFCCTLLKVRTGYLRQCPEMGSRLTPPVAGADWNTWCRTNRRKLRVFRRIIRESKNGGLKMSRHPFEPVIDIIKQRQHPITALFDVAGSLESLVPLLEGKSALRLAVHCRNIFHIRFISSNPLRIENFSMMTYAPQEHSAYERACRLYLQYKESGRALDFTRLYLNTDPGSNLYQRQDGSWWLRFNERDFKREKGDDLESGLRRAPYDVRIVPSVWPSLAEYLFRQRPILNQLLRDNVRLVRAKRNLTPLSLEQELDIIRCAYVFRPSWFVLTNLRGEHFINYRCTEQVPGTALRFQIICVTQKYLPDGIGFGPHACRHLVATEYIKNNPRGYEDAAEALHNTPEIVRKHYAWVEKADLIRPWSDYYEEVNDKYEKGEV